MKKYLFLLVCTSLFFSCNEDERPVVCGTANPLEDMAWIKAAIEGYSGSGLSEYTYLSKATYGRKTVFFFGSCCPNCNWALIVRDCNGNQLDSRISLSDLKDQTVIWKPANSLCNFS